MRNTRDELADLAWLCNRAHRFALRQLWEAARHAREGEHLLAEILVEQAERRLRFELN
jgi:hypothetical protein